VQPESFSVAVSGANLGLSSSESFADQQPFASGWVSDLVVDSLSAKLAVLEVTVQFSWELENPVVSQFPPTDASGSIFNVSRYFLQV